MSDSLTEKTPNNELKNLCSPYFYPTFISSIINKLDTSAINNDPEIEIRGKWGSRWDFLITCFGSGIGIVNLWSFPMRVFQNGGLTFIFVYLILTTLMSLPLFILEFGLGQFTSYGYINAFKIVPLFSGIGLSISMILILVLIYYNVIMSWIYYYFYASFYNKLPWAYCDNDFNSLYCVNTTVSKLNKTSVLSTNEYFYRKVLGYQNVNGTNVTFDELGELQSHLVISLLFVWITITLMSLRGMKVFSKIAYFTVLTPFAFIFILLIVSFTLAGSSIGIYAFFSSNSSKLYVPETYLHVLEQVLISSSCTNGIGLTLSSLNGFHDNFYRDSIIIILFGLLYNICNSFMIFAILGHLSYKTGLELKDMISGGPSILLINFTDALSDVRWANFWIILAMFGSLTLGIDCAVCMLEALILSISDQFKIMRKTIKHRMITVTIICFILYLSSFFLITNGGLNWILVIEKWIIGYIFITIAILECFIIGTLYGFLNFRLDIQAMTGFTMNMIWFILLSTVCPILLFLILCVNLESLGNIQINQKNVPLYVKLIIFGTYIIILSPIFIKMIYVLYYYRNYYKTGDYMKIILKPPVYYGPYYKTNWLKNETLIKKLLMYKDDPEFLQHVPKVENFEEIIEVAHNIYNTSVNVQIDGELAVINKFTTQKIKPFKNKTKNKDFWGSSTDESRSVLASDEFNLNLVSYDLKSIS